MHPETGEEVFGRWTGALCLMAYAIKFGLISSELAKQGNSEISLIYFGAAAALAGLAVWRVTNPLEVSVNWPEIGKRAAKGIL